MSFKIVIRREAEIELDEIFVWYEIQKVGLGFDFIHQFENTLDRIVRNPLHASYIMDDAWMMREVPVRNVFRTK